MSPDPKTRAENLDPSSGKRVVARNNLGTREMVFIEGVARKYLPMSASSLRALSHEAGGPWDQVWHHEGSVNATMRISDDLIETWYKKAARH